MQERQGIDEMYLLATDESGSGLQKAKDAYTVSRAQLLALRAFLSVSV